ncbi:hypothetical protein [Pontimicrobium sp. MEBiC01747]
MNTKKRVLGLAVCLGLLFSMNTIQNKVSANVGWAMTELCDTPDGLSHAATAMYTATGAIAGAELGAGIGSIGGPAGMVIGAGIGAL